MCGQSSICSAKGPLTLAVSGRRRLTGPGRCRHQTLFVRVDALKEIPSQILWRCCHIEGILLFVGLFVSTTHYGVSEASAARSYLICSESFERVQFGTITLSVWHLCDTVYLVLDCFCITLRILCPHKSGSPAGNAADGGQLATLDVCLQCVQKVKVSFLSVHASIFCQCCAGHLIRI